MGVSYSWGLWGATRSGTDQVGGEPLVTMSTDAKARPGVSAGRQMLLVTFLSITKRDQMPPQPAEAA